MTTPTHNTAPIIISCISQTVVRSCELTYSFTKQIAGLPNISQWDFGVYGRPVVPLTGFQRKENKSPSTIWENKEGAHSNNFL